MIKTPVQHILPSLFFYSFFIFLSAALPVKAGVLVIAYMDESKVVLGGRQNLQNRRRAQYGQKSS
jgi:hypothetical protein